jgi:hypothetical protein
MTPPPQDSAQKTPRAHEALVRRHLLLGWGALFFFIILGTCLEYFHAFKVPLYVDLDHQTRRLLWRLAHAHGALLSLLHLGAATTFSWLGERRAPQAAAVISFCLTGALFALPLGFFLGGLSAVDGDPGAFIALVPVGALFLLCGVGLLFLAVKKRA